MLLKRHGFSLWEATVEAEVPLGRLLGRGQEWSLIPGDNDGDGEKMLDSGYIILLIIFQCNCWLTRLSLS